MPTLKKRLTATVAKSASDCPAPSKSYVIYWSRDAAGFGVRVPARGVRAWVWECRIKGKTVRRALGNVEGRGAISFEDARAKARVLAGELTLGVDRSAVDRDTRKAASNDNKSSTLAEAVIEYVEAKRRPKDGLPLKRSTKDQYLQLIAPPPLRIYRPNRPGKGGALYSLASKPLDRISADDLRNLHETLCKRGASTATHALNCVLAVLNWNGVMVPGNPFGQGVAGRDRVVLKKSRGNPHPIPAEYLGAWWSAACKADSHARTVGADYLRFQILTGCRGIELAGNKYDSEPIYVRDVDITSARIVRTDTKNRTDHVLLLSRQALEIAKRNMKGKEPGDRLFSVKYPAKSLSHINVMAGMAPDAVKPHGLRATFTNIARKVTDIYTVNRLINHSIPRGDITGAHYIDVEAQELRDGWQKVADHLERAAEIFNGGGVVLPFPTQAQA